MEVLHAVFHRRLVRANLVGATLHQSQTARVHAFANFVVFDRGFHVGCTLRFDKLALEECDLLGIVELNYIEGFLR